MHRTILAAILFAGSAVAQAPEADSPSAPLSDGPGGATEATAEAEVREADQVNAESLRARIREMRMNLLLGGDQVRTAEGEARQFYGGKIEGVDTRIDALHSDLAAKRPGYELALDRALTGNSADERRAALGEASALRAEIGALEGEANELGTRRANLSQLVVAIEARDRERERLVARMEASSGVDESFSLPLASIGLAPVVTAKPAASPLQDDDLVRDLLSRDPIGGRGVLFELDPVGYWRRFPLRPPVDGLRQALQFPLPDLPESR